MKGNVLRAPDYLLAAILLVPAMAPAATSAKCVAGKPTAASYTWNFSAEAQQLLEGLRADAVSFHDQADHLQSLANFSNVSWQAHEDDLARMKTKLNDMGQKLCRLETIRRVVSPWERKAIDRAVSSIVLLKDNTEDAINYLNAHEGQTWVPEYQKYTDNLYKLSGRLANSMKEYIQYAKVNREDVQLQKELGMRKGS